MKKSFLLLSLALFLGGCVIDEPWYDYYESEYRPVLMDRSELDNSVKLLEPQRHNNYGKIYRKDSLLFINELYEGVHVYDNSDPRNPVNLGFISIPGNVDIAIKGKYIYADNAVDLVVIEFEGNKLSVVDRNKDVFPELQSPDGGSSPELSSRPENTIIIKWEKKWKS